MIVLSGRPSLRTPEGIRELEEGEALRFPDSEKIGVGERLPRGGGLRAFFRRSDGVDYFEGESPPGEHHGE